MEFLILGLEIGLSPKSIDLTVRHSTPNCLGLHRRARAHLKEGELLYPVTKTVFQISIKIFSYLMSNFNFFSLNFRYFSSIKKNSSNKVQNVFLLRTRIALPL